MSAKQDIAVKTGIIIGLLGLGLLGVAGLEAYREIAPFFLSGLSTKQKYASLAADIVRPGQSFVSKSIYLGDCLEVSRSVYARTQPSRSREPFLATCVSLLLDAARFPSSSVDEYRATRRRVAANDLPKQTVAVDGLNLRFEINLSTKDALVKGLDLIGTTLEYAADIDAFEASSTAFVPPMMAKLA